MYHKFSSGFKVAFMGPKVLFFADPSFPFIVTRTCFIEVSSFAVPATTNESLIILDTGG